MTTPPPNRLSMLKEQRGTAGVKPLGGRAYGSIAHLPGSRLGPSDYQANPGQAAFCITRARKGDIVFVEEKLDGTCVAVARHRGQILSLMRAGYPAEQSDYLIHREFAEWVRRDARRFAFLTEGERLCGEWLAVAHGTRYRLPHEPFVAFDLFRDGERLRREPFRSLMAEIGFVAPRLLHAGGAIAIEQIEPQLDAQPVLPGTFGGHGALDPVEGAVWRVENSEGVHTLAKYVRSQKQDGCYLPRDPLSSDYVRNTFPDRPAHA